MPKPKRAPRYTCRICCCTDDRPCAPRGCAWVTRRPPLCSACVTFLINLPQPRVAQVLALFDLADVAGQVPGLERAVNPFARG